MQILDGLTYSMLMMSHVSPWLKSLQRETLRKLNTVQLNVRSTIALKGLKFEHVSLYATVFHVNFF